MILVSLSTKCVIKTMIAEIILKFGVVLNPMAISS